MAVMPPVFYSVDKLPVELKYQAYAIPTTQSSLIIQHTMRRYIVAFSIRYAERLVDISCIEYPGLIAFTALVNTRAQWREN